jgi:hypothetical protein
VSLRTGVRVPWLDSTDQRLSLPAQVDGVLNGWIAPAIVGATGLAWAAATAWFLDGIAALLAALAGLYVLMIPLGQANGGRGLRRRWILGAALLVAVAVPAGSAVGILTLIEHGRGALVWTAVLLTLVVTVGVVVGGTVETHNTSRSSVGEQAIVVSFGAGLVGLVLLLGLRPALITGWALGAVPALWLPLGVFGQPIVDPPRIAGLRHAYAGIYTLVAVLILLILPDRWSLPSWEVVAGFIVGTLYGLLIGSVVRTLCGELILEVAMVVAGESLAWRRSFLRYAADRSLLTRTDEEYRFIHLLVRDHLADCDPAALAEAVVRRRAELSA